MTEQEGKRAPAIGARPGGPTLADALVLAGVRAGVQAGVRAGIGGPAYEVAR